MAKTIISTITPEFPECPGYGFESQPQYLVNINARQGGFERVDRRWDRPLIVFTSVPVGDRHEDDIQEILNFWHALMGRSTMFIIKDWTDFKSCPVQNDVSILDQPFELVTLDGGVTGYQLMKQYHFGSLQQDREITQPVGSTIRVANVSGTEQTDFTLDESTGILIPNGGFSGTPNSWGGEFNVPVRFDSELSVAVTEKKIQSANFSLREKKIRLSTKVPGSGGGSGDSTGSPSGPPIDPDGLIWTPTTTPPPVNMLALGYGSGVLIGCGGFTSDGRVYKSTDHGDTWTEVLHVASHTASCVGFDSSTGTFMVGFDSRRAYRSTDGGDTWTGPVDTTDIGDVRSIAADGAGHWEATGSNTSGGVNNYSKSTNDGVTWSRPGVSNIGGFQSTSLYWDSVNSRWVAQAVNSSSKPVIVTSTDGSTWSTHGYDSDVLGTSFNLGFDGTTWTVAVNGADPSLTPPFRKNTDVTAFFGTTGHSLPLTNQLYGTAVGDGLYFVIDQFCNVANSTDGVTFHKGDTGIGLNSLSVGTLIYMADVHTFIFGNNSSVTPVLTRYTVP